MIKTCAICGKQFQTIQNGGSRLYCFDCVPLGLDVKQRTICKRQAAKHEAVKRLGGKCEKCGETREHILAFHHLDPNQKTDNPSRLLANSQIKEFFEEIDNCVLLCANCHGDFHFLESNNGITIQEYLNKEVSRLAYDMGIQNIKEENEETLTKLQQIQLQQDLLKKNEKHIYQGKVIAYKDTWVREFNTVKECVEYFKENIWQDATIDNISDGIRRVLNGVRKTYHQYRFEKDE